MNAKYQVLDYEQRILKLEEANIKGVAQTQKEYSFASTYDVKDLTIAERLDEARRHMLANATVICCAVCVIYIIFISTRFFVQRWVKNFKPISKHLIVMTSLEYVFSFL
jgi:hypothetical protein